MAAKLTNGCSLLRASAVCAPSSGVRPRRCLHLHPSLLNARATGSASPVPRCCFWPSRLFLGHSSYASGGPSSAPRLVDLVMEELREELKSGKRLRATGRTMLLSNELAEDRLEKQVLQKGMLLEFRKDSERIFLAVAQKPDGKKNWIVYDQNGATSSIKPQQITYIIPGIMDLDHSEIVDFVHKAHDLLDPSILECAWIELLEKNKLVTTEELAEIVYGCRDPLESYCAHLLLSKDEVYFTVKESKGFSFVYQPRPTAQVEELIQRKHLKEASEKELEDFVLLLTSAKASAPNAKPPRSSWIMNEKIRRKLESLEAYAIDACKSDEQKRIAGRILKAMGLAKMSSSAIQLLIDIGYFPVHVNLDLLKLNICIDYSEEILLEAENLLLASADPDEMDRKDLTSLKVYAIDVDEADELDDALSAMRLQDGRIRVWIHVADPSCYVQLHSIIDREARRRGTSIFLPTATFPMFPQKLAMEGMSLQQGKHCRAVTVSVILHPDGSIAEYTVENSIIRPTYMLTYESATELLHLNLEEETELKILSEAAALRLQWRCQQGAIDTATIEPRIKVSDPDSAEPPIHLYVENQAGPAMRLVTEMMILCGEVIATFGSCNNIPLPYRGQPQSNLSVSAFSHLPEGPVRSSAIVKIMRAVEMDFRKPIRHGVLGIPGYVQFTSPIRRYVDLLAHYQVKAFLRGDALPFSAGQLEGITSVVNIQSRVARRLSNNNLRYWLLEFLRREPKGRKFRAVVLRFIKDRMALILLLEELTKERVKAAAAAKLLQEKAEENLKMELQQKEEEMELKLMELQELGKAELNAAIAKEKSSHMEKMTEANLHIKGLCMAFYARSEEARQSNSIHKLALGALALEDSLSKGLPIKEEIDALHSSLMGLDKDLLLDLVLTTLPEETLKNGTDTLLQLSLKFDTLKGTLRHFGLIPPGGGGILAHTMAHIASSIKMRESNISGDGIESIITGVERFLAEGRLAEAADALEKGVSGTAAEGAVGEWVRRARNRAITEQALILLQAYATSISLS